MNPLEIKIEALCNYFNIFESEYYGRDFVNDARRSFIKHYQYQTPIEIDKLYLSAINNTIGLYNTYNTNL